RKKKQPRKRAAGFSMVELLCLLHEHVGAAGHGGSVTPLNALVLRFLGSQAIAASCRALGAWSHVSGKRFCRCLDDTRGPPFTPLESVELGLVEMLKLGRDGRGNPENRTRIIANCRRAESLVCLYGSLSGLHRELDWGSGANPGGLRGAEKGLSSFLLGGVQGLSLTPCLNLRRIRVRQCSLGPEDVAQLLHCSPHLEQVWIANEQLFGLADALADVPPRCSKLWALELQDCHLSGMDAEALLLQGLLPGLRRAHLQAMDLQGLGLAQQEQQEQQEQQQPLASLQELALLDCNLGRPEALAVLSCFPGLEILTLCGNSLGLGSGGWNSEAAGRWPPLPRLRRADLRHCELDSEDERQLRSCLPPCAELLCNQRLSSVEPTGNSNNNNSDGGPGSLPAGQHVIFDSASSDDEA
ncbi:unnamed protein product, partial [Polarella glacialis]